MKKLIGLLTIVLVALALPASFAGTEEKETKAANKRARIDAVAEETLEHLFGESPQAKKLFDEAFGYAVFSSVKVAVGISGGGGSGVAVDQQSGDRTYMKMGTAGVGLGLGGKKYQIVFLFEDERAFENFVEKGWQADTSASATAGTAGAGVASTFSNGLVVYQFSDKGLMAQAEIAGTKYWKSDKLD
jgi:lipid-binding SYLF domain-containing protein